MKVQEKLKQFQLERKAILATNFYNYETLKGILEAASQVQAPVMLQLTKSSIDYMGLKRAVVLARQGLEDYRLDGCIHLDHGGSVELVQCCLDAGFESVMIDASEKSMEENIETTCKVVEMARPYGANVEAELGYVPKLGQMQDSSGFTTVEDAVRFVRLHRWMLWLWLLGRLMDFINRHLVSISTVWPRYMPQPMWFWFCTGVRVFLTIWFGRLFATV